MMTQPFTLGARPARGAWASSGKGRSALLGAVLAAACARGDARQARAYAPPSDRAAGADSVSPERQDSVNRASVGYVIDSIHTPAEELRRFRADIAVKPEALTNGATDRDALVRKWTDALEARDSVTLIRLAVNRPEFAFLIYPESPLGRHPYRQTPAASWLQLSNGSVQGFRRSLNALGGKSLSILSYACAPQPERQGSNRVWSDCRVRRVRAPGDTVVQHLFGPIVERHGQFKFLSLANDL